MGNESTNPDDRSPELKRISNKVLEVEFFLEQLKMLRSFDEMRYFLSAFLTAARSIPDVINSCYAKREGFKNWWSQERTALDGPAEKYLDKERNLSVHEGKSGMKQKLYVTSRVEVPANDTVKVSFMGRDLHDPSKYTVQSLGDPELKPKASFEVKHEWQFTKFPYEKGVDLCSNYMQTLKSLASKAVQKMEARTAPKPNAL